MRWTSCLVALALSAGAAGAQGIGDQAKGSSAMPMAAGNQPRPVNWNSDGVPRPPSMWRGQGESWQQHYRACRQQHGTSYNRQTDMVTRNGRRSRCSS